MSALPAPAAPSVAQQIEARLRDRLQPTRLEVIDESAAHAGHAGAGDAGVGTHLRVRIAAPVFASHGRVQRHRLVYDALRDFLSQGVHALAVEIVD